MKKYIKKHLRLFSISVIFGIISAIGQVFAFKILKNSMDTALTGNLDEFKEVILLVAGYLIMMGIISYLFGFINNKLKDYIIKDYRKEVYSGIMKMKYQQFDSANRAEYLSALINDMKMVEENYLTPLFLVMQCLFLVIATIIMLFSINIKVAIALMLSVLLMFIIPSLLGKSLQNRQDIVSQKIKKFISKTKDILSGFEVIKSFHAFTHFHSKFEKENIEVPQSKINSDNLLTLNQGFSETLGNLCQFVVVFLSGYLIIEGEITAGATLVLLQLSGLLITPIINLLTNSKDARSSTYY